MAGNKMDNAVNTDGKNMWRDAAILFAITLISGLLLGLVLFTVKILRGQNASDILALVTGMSAAGFFYRLIKAKSRKKFDICWASLCTLLALFFLYRFFTGAP